MPLDYTVGEGVDDIEGRPLFHGIGVEDWFFDLKSRDGQSNVNFYYLRIERYVPGGIRFHGNRDILEQWNGNNTVYGCYFYEIGNKWYPDAHYGYGAVDLVNSDNNWIENNHIVKAENKSGSDASHMHAVYLAHNSDRNQIERNRVERISGDPIRVRDFSNKNVINSNNIIEAGKYAYYSTYRNTERNECPSWENEFRSNIVNCGYNGESIQLFRYFVRYNGNGALDDGPEYPTGDCAEFDRWLYTSGNERPCL